jgi:hypothetical protein
MHTAHIIPFPLIVIFALGSNMSAGKPLMAVNLNIDFITLQCMHFGLDTDMTGENEKRKFKIML